MPVRVHFSVHRFVHVHGAAATPAEEFRLKSKTCGDFGSGGRDRTYDQLINSETELWLAGVSEGLRKLASRMKNSYLKLVYIKWALA